MQEDLIGTPVLNRQVWKPTGMRVEVKRGVNIKGDDHGTLKGEDDLLTV